jgi:hypothetical protein
MQPEQAKVCANIKEGAGTTGVRREEFVCLFVCGTRTANAPARKTRIPSCCDDDEASRTAAVAMPRTSLHASASSAAPSVPPPTIDSHNVRYFSIGLL